jgi:hypothetical protein
MHPWAGYAGAIEAANAIAAAQAVANANAMAAAQAVANANAMAAATAAAQAAAGVTTGRGQFVQALQTHLASIIPAVAANPDASAHLAAAQTIATQLA